VRMRFLKDNLWVVGLIVSGLLFLNIFIQGRRLYSIEENQFYSYQELGKDSRAFASLEILNSIRSLRSRTDTKFSLVLNLELLGTIIGSPSLAFISCSDSEKHGLYKLNDVVAGARIVSITTGGIILEKDGLRQELLLKRSTTDAGQDKGLVIDTISPNEMIVSRSGVVNQLDRAKQLLAKVKILPVPDISSGRLKGFRIDNVPLGSIIDRAGIKSKDIIYSVAGQRLESTQDALQVFASIQKQSRIAVDVLRNGEPITLTYEFKD
jgi:type II secretion system protein C